MKSQTKKASTAPKIKEQEYTGWKKYYFKIPELIRMIFWALVIVIPIKIFLISPHMVIGSSMEPNFHGGDYLLVSKINTLERGDVIVIKPPKGNGFFDSSYIKRLLGLPGETIQIKDKKLFIKTLDSNEFIEVEEPYINNSNRMPNMEVIIGNDEYFVMGDNRGNSLDSRDLGAFKISDTLGEPIVRVFGRSETIKSDSFSFLGLEWFFQTYPEKQNFSY